MMTVYNPSASSNVMQPRPPSSTLVALLALLFSFSLAACGAGGGGGGGGGDQPAASSSSPAPATGGGSTGGGSTGGGGGAAVSGLEAFQQTVYPILQQYCTNCHSGLGPGFPSISHPDSSVAYSAVVDNQKVNLSTPASSRLVLKLEEMHNCWSGTCADDATEMRMAIETWAGLVSSGGGGAAGGGASGGGGAGAGGTGNTGGAAILSATQSFADAGAGAGAARVDANVIALYRLQEGSGQTAFDTSGVEPAMNLSLDGQIEWLPGGGLLNTGGKAAASADTSRKLFDRIADVGTGSQQYSIEAWIVPDSTNQTGPARIVTYSQDTGSRNFTMGQQGPEYDFRNRSRAAGIGANGTPSLATSEDDLGALLQHVVMTFDQGGGRRIYVNGTFTGDADGNGGAALDVWNAGYRFALGNELTDNRLWRGELYLVAIHDRALSAAQVTQNYLAGLNEKYILRFSLEQWLEPGTFMEFEASEFDAFSYLFCFPTFVGPNPAGTAVEGIRLAVNGTVPVAAQSFASTSTTIVQPQQLVSDQCSLVLKDQGPEMDQFALTFELLGPHENRPSEPAPNVPPNDSVVLYPDIGVRDFAQINDTMASLTGVDPNGGAVSRAFEELQQQLPASSDLRSFVSAMQVAIQKLSLEYCDQLVDSGALRTAFFGNEFQFNERVVVAFANQADRDLIIDALVDRMYNTGVANQPLRTEVDPILNQLIDDLTMGCNANNCDAGETRAVVKGVCSAVLSSAPVHIQ